MSNLTAIEQAILVEILHQEGEVAKQIEPDRNFAWRHREGIRWAARHMQWDAERKHGPRLSLARWFNLADGSADKYAEPTKAEPGNLSDLPSGWTLATVEQLYRAERPISYGVLQPGGDLRDGVPLVRVCDINDGKVSIEQMKKIDPRISAQYQRTLLEGGEVLLTVVGTIGRTAVAPAVLQGANTARAVAVIAIVSPADPHFIEIVLRESSMRARLTRAAHEVARKTLNLEDVRIACLPLAPLPEQNQIVAEVERRLSIVDELESQVAADLKRAGRLRQSILKRAFAGRLVPQDPNDEPAAKLLERIRASRSVEKETGTDGSPARTRERSRRSS